jgi:arylamine N-acetyltransferase
LTVPVEEILEALELDHAEPSLPYLERLFTRFNERVPFESASKIVRDSDISDPREKPRRPEIFWTDHIALGAGGTCFARAAAFRELLTGLGFPSRIVLGRVQADFDHAAILVESGSEEWICDVGFPLPALLPRREGETETALKTLRVGRISRGWHIEFVDGVPEGPQSLDVFEAPVGAEELAARWRETFDRRSRFLTSVSLRVERPGRALSYAAGELRVDDLHSRTRIPVPAPRSAPLSEQFGVDAGLLERAFALVGDPDPAIPSAEVSVYLEAGGSPREAFDAIGSADAYARFLSGAARVSVETASGLWRVRLSPPEAADAAGSLEEEVIPEPENLRLRVRRGSRESFYEVAERSGRTYLLRRQVLAGSGFDLLRNDSLRGRIAGTLAVDLLAWVRSLKVRI